MSKHIGGLAPDGQDEVEGFHESYLDDFKAVSKHKNVVNMADIIQAHPELTYNEVQARLAADHECFVEVQGGRGHFFQLFNGSHVVFHHRGREAKQYYETVLPNVSGGEYRVIEPGRKQKNITQHDEQEQRLFKAIEDRLLAQACGRCVLKAPKHVPHKTSAVRAAPQAAHVMNYEVDLRSENEENVGLVSSDLLADAALEEDYMSGAGGYCEVTSQMRQVCRQ